jgi:uncharacterized protein YdeI (YjbR/CyaY-like superfamily)
MAPVKVDPGEVREFKTAAAFERWLKANHDTADGVWVRLYKKGSGIASITPLEAIDVALCWGWIDAIRKGLDDKSFLQRYTPRRKASIWSKVNVDNVARLTKAGRMQPPGQTEVDRAKADGRWDKAYASSPDKIMPKDLMDAIEAEPRAMAMFRTLTSQNRFALGFRVHNMKTEAGRKKKIETFVAMLKRGETIYPQKAKAE